MLAGRECATPGNRPSARLDAARFYAMLCAALLLVMRCKMIRHNRFLSSSSSPVLVPALMLAVLLLGALPAPSAAAAAAPAPAATPASAAPAGASPPPPAAASSSTPARPPAAAGAAGPARRIEIPGFAGKPFPYTIEVPAGWQVLSSAQVPGGVFLGPAGVSEPAGDPRVIFIRVSPTPVIDPGAVVASIKKSAGVTWSAPLVEVREVGGIRGVLVRMDSGSGDQARSTLVLKMPLGPSKSLDFMASSPRAEFEHRLPGYQRVILSVLPAS